GAGRRAGAHTRMGGRMGWSAHRGDTSRADRGSGQVMTALLGKRVLRIVVVASALAALAACSSLTGSGVSVGRTGDNPAPLVVPEGTDPDDAVLGLREHPRIIAAYGGVYSDRQAEIMVARI